MSRIVQPPLGTPINAGHPLANQLAGYWLLNEGGGQLATNRVSGTTKDGTLTSGAVFKVGQGGTAVTFDGTDDVITVPTTINPGSYPLTLMAWVRVDSTAAVRSIMSIGVNQQEHVLLVITPTPRFWALTQVGAANSQATGSTPVVTGIWYHVVGVYASATSRKIYVNGRLEATEATSRAPSTASPTIRIGDRNGLTTQRFAGLINHAALWTRALTDSEVAGLYQNPYQLFDPFTERMGAFATAVVPRRTLMGVGA